jgi:hypothetical protein
MLSVQNIRAGLFLTCRLGSRKSLSKEKFGGPDIVSAMKTARDLQIASIGKGHYAHGQAHGRQSLQY